MIRSGVILAAGEGTRLKSLSGGLPKPMVKLDGRPLLEHVVKRLMEAGVTEVNVVVGYRAYLLGELLADLEDRYPVRVSFGLCPDYLRGNGASLLAARSLVEDDWFLVTMCDHLVDPAIYRMAMEAHVDMGDLFLCVDRDPVLPSQLDDATKVLVEGGRIVSIGKSIPRWNAIDTGVFAMSRRIFDALSSWPGWTLTVSNGVQHLIDRGGLALAIDVSGLYWSDVDTPDDLRATEESLPLASHTAPKALIEEEREVKKVFEETLQFDET